MNVTAGVHDNMGWDHPNIPAAIGISIGAGLSTALGGALVFFPEALKHVPQQVILATSLALSAGVMIYVSFIEIYAKSLGAIATVPGISEGGASAITTVFFFLGMAFCVLLEVIVHCVMKQGNASHDVICAAHADLPAAKATSSTADVEMASSSPPPSPPPHDAEPASVQVEVAGGGAAAGGVLASKGEGESLTRMGMMTAAAIAVHNFPEGLATFMATLESAQLGASLGVAIAVHNIPEGLCVAMPIYYATGSKRRAFFWSVLSGVTEPIGGILGFAALQPVFTELVFGIVFSMVGGMMIFIVCHELLPAAHRYMGNGAKTTAWLILGMMIMALSLVLFVL